ncbi:hypothetical protein GLOIN_2v1594777 [Rhizophagus clarus]|uniref:CBM1 domain-containing protein n=1 Tax=Rhizophagus clarus TaxID=94130 RepID=A0A8H3LSW4_9GLOM|nr:hypothetical protein GLOIN_2v1594777 [Rhizophagus clarus]
MASKFLYFLMFLMFVSSVWSACNPNTPCTCPKGLAQGEYCGGQLPGCNRVGSVFECSPQGDTCEFGPRDSCAQCGKLQC